MTIRIDDRTPEQRKTHPWLVTATDRFMSGWGQAKNGLSKCAWACESYSRARELRKWVKSRNEMRYVNIVHGKWYPRAAHVHIYLDNGR